MIKLLKKFAAQPKKQLLLSAAIAVLCTISFGLFFAKGVTDAGGDGYETFRITFYSMARSFYFNAPLFIGYIFPLFVGILTFIPCKKGKVYLLFSAVLLACGVMCALTFECYLLPFDEEIKEFVTKSGTHVAAAPVAAACMTLLAAVLCAVKAFSPTRKEEEESAPAEDAAPVQEGQEA